MSTPAVDKLLVALKATGNKDANSHCWQDPGSSESYDYREEKVVDSSEKRYIKCGGFTFFTVWLLCDRPTSEGNKS